MKIKYFENKIYLKIIKFFLIFKSILLSKLIMK